MRCRLRLRQQITGCIGTFLIFFAASCHIMPQSQPTNSSASSSGGPRKEASKGEADADKRGADRDKTTPQTCEMTSCNSGEVFNSESCLCESSTNQLKFALKCGSPAVRSLCDNGEEATLRDVPPQSQPYCDEIEATLDKSCSQLNAGCVERKAYYCPDGSLLNSIPGLRCIPDKVDLRNDCPISSRSFKSSIHYVNDKEAQQISKGILNLRIANYHYNEKSKFSGEPALGFIIEDYPSLPYTNSQSKVIDQYSYISAAVVTIQTQQTEIDSLRKRIDQLEKTILDIKREKDK